MRRVVLGIACIALLVFSFAGCSGSSTAGSNAGSKTEPRAESKAESTGYSQEITDELFSDSRSDVELVVYKQDDKVYTADGLYEIPELRVRDDLQNDRYYRVVADITYLNGGVAGYVDYPQIDRIISIEEISYAGSVESAAEKE